MSKSYKQKFKKNDKAWSTFAPNSKLQVKAVGHVYEHNAIEWVENWRYTKLGTYSEEAAQMGINMRFAPFDPVAEAAKYPLAEELEVSREDFILSEEQIAELAAIPAREAVRRDNRKAELYRAWVAPRKARNIEIRSANLQNAESLKRIPRLSQKFKDMNAKIFQEMEADMNEAARDIIRRTVVTRHLPAAGAPQGGGGEAAAAAAEQQQTLSYEEARSSWDFIWILEAAIHGLIKKGADEDDPHEVFIRKKEFKKKIEDFKQGSLEWGAYVRAMKRLWEHGSHLGLNLDETERVAILMGNVSPDIFRHQIAMFGDPVQRLSMPHFKSYDDLVEALSAVVRMTDDGVLIRAQGQGRVESSFTVSEADQDAQELRNACHICGAVATDFHFARDCPLRDKTKSVAENIAYFKKNPRSLKEKRVKVKQDKKRKREIESGSDSEQTDAAQQSRVEEIRSETTMVSFEVAYNLEANESRCPVDRSSCRGVGSDQVDFILDTATESSTVKPADLSLASHLRVDPISLVGIGDRSVVSDSCGDSIFGQTRVLEQKNNLVSQYQVRQYYKLVEIDPDCFELVPRESCSELSTWTFARDYSRYGDNLLHCTVDRLRFVDTAACREEHLSNAQTDVPEKVGQVHEDLNHATMSALVHTVEGDAENVKQLPDGGDIKEVLADLESPFLERLSQQPGSCDTVDSGNDQGLIKEDIEGSEYTPPVGLGDSTGSIKPTPVPKGILIGKEGGYPQRERHPPIRFLQPDSHNHCARTYSQAYKIRPKKVVKRALRKSLLKSEQRAINAFILRFGRTEEDLHDGIEDPQKVVLNTISSPKMVVTADSSYALE